MSKRVITIGLVVVILFGISWMVSAKESFLNFFKLREMPEASINSQPEPQVNLTTTTKPRSTTSTQVAITVAELNSHRDLYVGQEVMVNGKIVFMPQYSSDSAVKCDNGVDDCSPIKSVDVYLENLTKPPLGVDYRILLYKKGEQYPCTHTASQIGCPPYTNGDIRTVTGVVGEAQGNFFLDVK